MGTVELVILISVMAVVAIGGYTVSVLLYLTIYRSYQEWKTLGNTVSQAQFALVSSTAACFSPILSWVPFVGQVASLAAFVMPFMTKSAEKQYRDATGRATTASRRIGKFYMAGGVLSALAAVLYTVIAVIGVIATNVGEPASYMPETNIVGVIIYYGFFMIFALAFGVLLIWSGKYHLSAANGVPIVPMAPQAPEQFTAQPVVPAPPMPPVMTQIPPDNQ